MNNFIHKMRQPIILLFFIILATTKIFASTAAEYTGINEEKSHHVKHISVRTFEKNIDKIYKELNQKKFFNSKNCDAYITQITEFLLFKGGKAYLPFNKNDFNILQRRSYIIVNKLFYLRLLLRKKLKEFHHHGNLSQTCVNKIRKAFRYTRFLEEFITEIGVNMQTHPPVADPQDFSQQKYQFYLNPKLKNFNFKSGDILLVRTSSFVSAIIARIGDEDGQFSHAAMVYVDESGEIKVMESLIEAGTIITPYEKWRKINNHSRALLFRHDDEALAKKAALKLYNIIQKRQASKDFIPYDFTMNDSDNNQIFCAEMVQYAFKLAGDNRLPTFRTGFKTFGNHTFLNELTVSVEDTFTPGDLEVEPSINLVAEWRNYEATRLSRLQDVIQTKILYWMSEKHYYLKRTFRSFIGTTVGLAGRTLFGLNSDKIPANMPFGFMENIIKLNDLSNILEKYLSDLETEYFKRYGHSMGYFRMMKEMEALRIEDCQSYINRSKEMIQKLHDIDTLSEPYESPKPIFHNLFNTENGLNCKL
ncbi:MAG: YiiX/YebB-like N1pC/P60 family cysteine hydrolase [Campylobacterota bacterium]|nr:YiiX/YebB-like N1pC/P60 family cysteine hydrolase [Campylobacterota bacterium]